MHDDRPVLAATVGEWPRMWPKGQAGKAEPEWPCMRSSEVGAGCLQTVLATEIVCVSRYTQHWIAAAGLASEAIKQEFATHAREEQSHMMAVAERINQLGGKPDLNPDLLTSRSASQYAEGETLVDMIRENLVAERIAVEHYRELVRYFGDDDPTTRVIIEGILGVEEEHANDMHDLLISQGGKLMLKK